MKTKSILLGGLMCLMVFIMTACSGSVEDSEDVLLTIKFTDFESQSQVIGVNIVYKIDIVGPDSQTITANKGEDIQVKLNATGQYEITVTAYKNVIGGEVFAYGHATIDITPGPNTVPIYNFDFAGALSLSVTPAPGAFNTEGTYYYNSGLQITLTLISSSSVIPEGTIIRYTTNGSEPTKTSPMIYALGTTITIDTLGTTITLKAKAFSGDDSVVKDSPVLTANYTLNNTWTVGVNNGTATTTALVFNFTLPISALTLSDIIITNGTGSFASTTQPTASNGGKTWTLNRDTISDGSIEVNINKTGIKSGKQTIERIFGIFPLWSAVADSKFNGTNIFSIAYGNGKFVAVGDAGKMAYSSDGRIWTAIPAGTTNGTTTTFGPNHIVSVAYGNVNSTPRFVAGGNNCGKMAYSSDGVSWTAVTDSKFGTSDHINAIACGSYGTGGYVAGGSDGKMAYSTTGISWTAVSSQLPTHIFSIAFSNSRYVAVGDSGKIAYSGNSTNWTVVSNTFGTSHIRGVVSWGGNGYYIAVGDSGKTAYSSDGINWITMYGGSIGSSILRGVAYGNDLYVAVGDGGKIVYSPRQ